ncbi:DUF502 domain-containing protein [soil metagenome]
MNKIFARRLLKYFLRGLLFLVPITVTLYIIVGSIQWLDNLIPVSIPFLGLLIILTIITVFGYLGTTLLAKPFFDLFEEVLIRLPLVNIIYTSLKDLIGAFVGDKKKFNKPVMVCMNNEAQVYKLGFVTQVDLSQIGMPGKVAVYLPHSYNFSGNLFFVPLESVTPLDVSSAEMMKFIVSGGVSGINSIDSEEAQVVKPV